jgi:hypothetical protein
MLIKPLPYIYKFFHVDLKGARLQKAPRINEKMAFQGPKKVVECYHDFAARGKYF